MCDCIAKFDEKLAEHNAALVTTLFAQPARVCIETYKIDEKKRGFRPPKAMASFCPFCGESYSKPTEATDALKLAGVVL